MREKVVGLLLALVSCQALNTEVFYEAPDGVTIRVQDEQSIRSIRFEVQSERQSFGHLVEFQVDGVWEYNEPKLDVEEGEQIQYRTTVNHEGGQDVGEWQMYQIPVNQHNRPVRSMKRAVIWQDQYNSWNSGDYKIECSAWGGGNNEFQVYTNQHENIYVKNGHLYLKPTLTVDDPHYTENRLCHGRMVVSEFCGYCNQATNWGCDRTAVNGNCLNPVKSGKVTSHAAIKYGTVTVRAKCPKGKWLWPAIWMLPRDWHYGGWPRSGEIDIYEGRGNAHIYCGSNDHGNGEVASTLHWGPDAGQNKFSMTHGEVDGDFCNSFHNYVLDWTADHIKVSVDGRQVLYVPTPSNSFWHWGGLHGNNIWSSGGKNAPFDQPFQLIMNVAVGGQYFPQNCGYKDSNYHDYSRPWHDGSAKQMAEFWYAKNDWLSSWHGEDAALQVDYVKFEH